MVLCGLRCMGEKRFEVVEGVEAEKEDEEEKGSTQSFLTSALARAGDLWAWLRADPDDASFSDSPQLLKEPPAAQAVWRTLRRMPGVMAVWCKCPTFEIHEASNEARAQLPGPLKGLSAPSLLADAGTAQHFRNACEVTSTWNRHAIATEGCMCYEFGKVLLNYSHLPGRCGPRSAAGSRWRSPFPHRALPSQAEVLLAEFDLQVHEQPWDPTR